jgi:hypothetical protein
MDANCKPKRKRKKVEGIFVLPKLKKDKHEKNVQILSGDVPDEKEYSQGTNLVGVRYESFVG